MIQAPGLFFIWTWQQQTGSTHSAAFLEIKNKYISHKWLGQGMSDTNKQYNRLNSNSRTTQIQKTCIWFSILPFLGKIFHQIFFPKISRRESRYGKKQTNIDSNCRFYLFYV